MKIYFVRHGKTQWNLQSRYQGAGGDSPLLPESYKEMKELARYYYRVNFTRIYSSPIKRARVTAMQISDHLKSHPPVSLWSRLEEFHLGKMEGMKFKDVRQRYPKEYDAFRYHPDQYDPSRIGGESFTQVINRMTPAIKLIAQCNPLDSNVMVVSHGAALNAEVNSLLGSSLANLRKRGGLANTSTTILSTDDRGRSFHLVKWNNTEYIPHRIDPTDVI